VTTVEVVREPLYRTAPDCRTSFGDLAAKVGADLGLPPDDEQQAILDAIYTEREPEVPRYRHVCTVGPRQNIKTSTKVIAAMTDLFVLGIPEAIWTAHQSKTSTKSFQDMQRRINGHPDYANLVEFKSGRGEELIFLPGTSVSLEFRARSGGSGRGFTTDRLTLDEALYLTAADLGALLPTMLTRRGAQVRYASSAGLPRSGALRDLRDRGRAGTDPRLFYVEYGAERRACESDTCTHLVGNPGCALDDRELWWQANSALWCGRIEEDAIDDLRRAMPPEEFMREVLVWWQDPLRGGGVFDLDLWASLGTRSQRMTKPVLSVEVALDRSVTTLGAAWEVKGRPHLEIVEDHPGTGWVVARAVELKRKYGVTGAVIDMGSEAAGLVDDLEAAGFRVVKVGSTERVTACGTFFDLASTARLTHNGDPAISNALAAARWKDVGDGARVFSRRRSAGDIRDLYAVVLALHGLATRPAAANYVSMRDRMGAKE
jgi:hypothetical protein